MSATSLKPHGHIHEKMHPAWRPGQSGNPAGRPKSARGKLSELFLRDFYEAWEAHGKKALHEIATKHPVEFVRAAISLLPKEVHIPPIPRSPMDDMSMEELTEIIEAIRAINAAEMAQPASGRIEKSTAETQAPAIVNRRR
jgi:hypothetical protein